MGGRNSDSCVGEARSRRRLETWTGGVLAAIAGVVLLVACGTDAVAVEACRDVEEARCRKAPSCGLDLTKPVHSDSPGSDVDACIRFYRDACLHGLATDKDPGGPAVQACVDFIQGSTDCDVVKHPEAYPACAWLVPPAPVPDAGDAPDAEVDGSSADASDDAAID
jgi:hypothetical protein